MMAANPEVGEDFERSITPVADWAAASTGLPVVYDRAETPAGATVLIYPLDLELPTAPMATGARTRVAELSVRLLVSVVGASAFEAAATTSGLALDAAIDSQWRVDARPARASRSGVRSSAPGPGLRPRRAGSTDRRPAPAPLVRDRLKVVPARMRTVIGRVVAPTGEPLAAARVALADGNRASATDTAAGSASRSPPSRAAAATERRRARHERRRRDRRPAGRDRRRPRGPHSPRA